MKKSRRSECGAWQVILLPDVTGFILHAPRTPSFSGSSDFTYHYRNTVRLTVMLFSSHLAAVTHQLIAPGQIFHRRAPDMHQTAEREQQEQRHAQYHMQAEYRRHAFKML